jgi:phosphoglycolate phosphatase-like HAD superfamily hydrolase
VSGTLGEAVVSDFDGTLARLVIPWSALRETLGVGRIEELWRDADMGRWDPVTRAEVEAARTAAPVPSVLDALEAVPAIAVLTNNDEQAVDTFLEQHPQLRARVCTVVGRRTLRGPKSDFEVFAAGYARCVEALAGAGDSIAYVGDMSYELDYARRLGARAFDVTDLETAPPGSEKG